jgi:hypothetical protein
VVNTWVKSNDESEEGTDAGAGAGPRGSGPSPPRAGARVGAGPLRGGPPSEDILKGGCAGGRAG